MSECVEGLARLIRMKRENLLCLKTSSSSSSSYLYGSCSQKHGKQIGQGVRDVKMESSEQTADSSMGGERKRSRGGELLGGKFK